MRQNNDVIALRRPRPFCCSTAALLSSLPKVGFTQLSCFIRRIIQLSGSGIFRTLKRRRRYFTYSRCMFNRDCSTADMPGDEAIATWVQRHLKKVRIVAPPLSVVATCSHAIQSVLELVSGQCRPLPDKVFIKKKFQKSLQIFHA